MTSRYGYIYYNYILKNDVPYNPHHYTKRFLRVDSSLNPLCLFQGYTIPWRDGLFSVALGDVEEGRRKAYYHPLVSENEFSVYTDELKNQVQQLQVVVLHHSN